MSDNAELETLRDRVQRLEAEVRRRRSVTRSPVPHVKPRLRNGIAMVSNADNAASGYYSIDEQQWDESADSGAGALADNKNGFIGKTAYEVALGTELVVGDIVPFWQVWDRNGKLKLIIRDCATRIRAAQASQNWSYVGGITEWDEWRIKAHPLTWLGGTEDTDTDLTVYFSQFGTPGASTTRMGDPNVVDNQQFLYTTDGAGNRWCVSPWCDERIGTIRLWSGAVDELPQGWQLADGSNDPQGDPTIDLGSKFIVGYDTDDADYNAIGNTGGNKTQNISHAAGSADPSHEVWGDLSGTGAVVVAVGDITIPQHSNVPMRPPYYTLAYIIRVDNSVAWS